MSVPKAQVHLFRACLLSLEFSVPRISLRLGNDALNLFRGSELSEDWHFVERD